jgi:hypothetical protein
VYETFEATGGKEEKQVEAAFEEPYSPNKRSASLLRSLLALPLVAPHQVAVMDNKSYIRGH